MIPVPPSSRMCHVARRVVCVNDDAALSFSVISFVPVVMENVAVRVPDEQAQDGKFGGVPATVLSVVVSVPPLFDGRSMTLRK